MGTDQFTLSFNELKTKYCTQFRLHLHSVTSCVLGGSDSYWVSKKFTVKAFYPDVEKGLNVSSTLAAEVALKLH